MPFASISIRTDRYGRLRNRSRSRSPSSNKRRRNYDERSEKRRSRSRERRRRSIERVSSSKQTTPTDTSGIKVFSAPPPPMPAPPRVDRQLTLMRQVATLSGLADAGTFDKEEEQKLLEDEMVQRRQRIEKWRASRGINAKPSADLSSVASASSATNPNGPPSSKTKKLTQNDDDDDDGALWPSLKDSKTAFGAKKLSKPILLSGELQIKKVESAETAAMVIADDDADPLDAFMDTVQQEVKQLQQHQHAKNKAPSTALLINNQQTLTSSTLSTKGIESSRKKGELVSLDPEDALSQWVSEIEDSTAPGSSSARDLAEIQRLAGQPSLNKQQKLNKAFNHHNSEYEEFKKDFYCEVPEVVQMTDEQVADLRSQLEGIKVRGQACPKPILSWSHAGVSPKTREALRKAGYVKPTPIQAQAVPCIMSGRNVLGIAKTGSGKTLAFVLPFLRHRGAQRDREEGEGPIGLIVAPTRELAVQIAKECKRFCQPHGYSVVCVYGGLGTSEQIAALKSGADLIVCTPGRMIEMLTANSGRVTNLRRVTYMVLDEADRMFDMGFEPQVMFMLDHTNPKKQTVLFSATLPRQMEALASRVLGQNMIKIQVGGRSVVASDVEQHAILIDEDKKFLKLLELIGRYTAAEQGSGVALVFVDRQEKADMLLKDLMRASYTVMALHGGVDQFDRDSIINDFKNGNIQVLVATSVAARGLDIKNLMLVVNYDCPNHYEDYVHRCGRTGRAGNKGFAYTFITPLQERFTPDLVQGFEAAGQEAPYDLKVMYETYKAVLSAEGKQVKGGSGFGGRGFKFDDMEQAVAKESRKLQQALTTGAGEDDDVAAAGAEGGRLDAEIEGLFKSTRRVREGRPVGGTDIGNAGGATASNVKTSADIGQKLLMAQKRATQIRQDKVASEAEKFSVDTMLRAADATTKFLVSQTTSARGVAERVAEKIHAKLSYVKDEIPKIADGSMLEEEHAQTFEEELDINDFPQQVRFRLTCKDVLAGICEYAESYISVRGQHVPSGKQPKEGERKLHLLIESVSEMGASKAKSEIIRTVKEELLKMQHAPVVKSSRYKVV